MNFAEAIAIAIMQGVTELFPISSLGHAVILPALLDPSVDLKSAAFLPFLVVLHLGTAIALMTYFWRDWWDILVGLFIGGVGRDGDNRRRLLLLLIVATIPAVILGFAFEKKLRALFGVPEVAAGFLIANGFLLFFAERLRRNAQSEYTVGLTSHLDQLGFLGAFIIGVWQCLAFFPGISRSGSTIAGGLLAKLNHEQAARFSFLMATPVIVGASVLEIPKLFHGGTLETSALSPSTIVIGGVVAGLAAYLSVAFIMYYFKKHEFSALYPFAIYCVLFGSAALILLRI